ncbi:DEAD/DEAH box helicase family protein [Corallococcus exercitus]|uniref:DEAD/DEAH box helicase family protein n=1 Tax=Corallococcus exercitus TaxID=2316736 RepID=A0A7Y4JPN1_9BACT|nr:DEAD/DEAH box helicase family protein [Corallococcus exercitus]NOK07927.1 DEAD/DEAH box helicase family protein [Corallococcus exercitus]
MSSRHVNSVSGRLSLRKPQRRSLEILDRVMEIAQSNKGGDLKAALDVIRSEFPTVEDFERAFPSLCYALATGVGKTRLMGAFISYLHLEHSIRHFFVLAPNLTIYNKLVADFTPNTPKYVFQGIAEFAVKAPTLVTGENFEQKPQVLDLFERDDVIINIFNISKFNVRAADSRKIHRLSEFLGQSYFDYLAGLDDLVLIMDEAHRYRADTSMKSIEELKPVLGLELTATPQVESGSKSTRFKNVIYNYPLAKAMQDGYVKEPAVATRANFNPKSMSKEALELLKLEDGIRVHESVKVDLDVYAQQNGVRKVKPFMLVIAEDTDHASAIVKLIEDNQFFDGRYKGRVIQVHSGQKGAEKDENIERLLSVERPDEPTEIVVHVNMLKEGWDVTNLYTIVPLRTADSRTLVEQSIGRGLRLPYGKRTGVAAVDRLTIVAHDRFQDIVDEAKKDGYSFSTVNIGEDIEETPKQTVVVAPTFETLLGIPQPASEPSEVSATPSAAAKPMTLAPEPKFKKPEEAAAAKLTLDAIAKVVRDPQLVPGPKALQSEEVQKTLVAEVAQKQNGGQLTMYQTLSEKELVLVVREATAIYVAHTIAIPRVIVLPKGVVRAGFHDFTLDLSLFRLQPVSQEIMVQHLNSDTRDVIGALASGAAEEQIEDYVVRGLIDFDDVSYDEQADLLYNLAGQVVAHLRSYLKDDDEVRNVLIFHQRQIATLVHTQMQLHAWEEASSYESVVSQGFSEVRPQAFAAPAGEVVRAFDKPIENKVDIRKMLFGGFTKCLYPTQKFDSDTERRFAVVLEKDTAVIKWFKPGKGVFQIRYTADSDYEPDFVVETETEKLICEPKGADRMQDPVVLAKAHAAAIWCKHAKAHETANNGKPWRYVLIPHDAIADNMTVAGLAKTYTFAAPEEGK